VLLDDEKFYFALPEDVKEFTNTTKKQDNNEET
jgi:hypothetical protein